MAQQFLDGSDPATGIHQLGGARVAQPMRRHCDSHAFSSTSNAFSDQVFAHWPVAIEEYVSGWAGAAHGQVIVQRSDGHVSQVNSPVFLALALAHRQLASSQVEVI